MSPLVVVTGPGVSHSADDPPTVPIPRTGMRLCAARSCWSPATRVCWCEHHGLRVERFGSETATLLRAVAP